MQLNKRIFIGLTEISGYYSGLADGFEKLGIEFTIVGPSIHKFKYNHSKAKTSPFVKIYSYFARKFSKVNKLSPLGLILFTPVVISRFILFVWALFSHDVFIFSFGESFFKGYDLPILKYLGKKIIFNVGHGSEARPPYMNGAFLGPTGLHLDAKKLNKLTGKKKKNIFKIEQYADVIISNPTSSQFLERKFVNWFSIGVPFQKELASKSKDNSNKKIRILHSPSNPLTKGTPEIFKIINSLKEDNYDIEFINVTGVQHSVVMEELSKCDIVIDQMYSDTYMAGLATEAAWMSKPVIVGGFGWEYLNSIIPLDCRPPTIAVNPDQVKSKLIELMEASSKCREVGMSCRDFVEKKWDSKLVAGRYIQLIEGEIPEEWIVNPLDIDYFWGCGLTQGMVLENIKKLVAAYGFTSLQVSHNKNLLKKIILHIEKYA